MGDGLRGPTLRGDLCGQRHEARMPLGLLVAAAVLVVHQVHQLPQMPLLILMAILKYKVDPACHTPPKHCEAAQKSAGQFFKQDDYSARRQLSWYEKQRCKGLVRAPHGIDTCKATAGLSPAKSCSIAVSRSSLRTMSSA